MRVFQVNTYVGTGGAAIAAARLNRGLIRAGVDSHLLSPNLTAGLDAGEFTLLRFGKSLRERVWRHWRHFELGRLRRRHQPRPTAFDLFGYDLSSHGMALLDACGDADVLNFHWVSDFLDYSYVLPRLDPSIPLVWTLHDMNPATGGCFYARDCKAFHSVCRRCPELGSNQDRDMSTEIWNRKARALKALGPKLTLVTPSNWLAGQAKQSGLLGRYPVKVIPNGVDTQVFHPRERQQEKLRLGLNPEVPVALFVAAILDHPWKGLRHLAEAMPLVLDKLPQMQFAALGSADPIGRWPDGVRWLGAASQEEQVAQIYGCADLLIVPSLIDNFPNVILEAMASGVPSVGFRVGGVPEAISDGATGFVADTVDTKCLADTIIRLLHSVAKDRAGWSGRCRERATREFSLEVQADRYRLLYESLL